MKDPVVQVGEAVLRQKTRPVLKKELGSPALRKVIERMKRALAKEEFGVAIAAPQVGESLRMFVVAGHVFKNPDEKPIDTNEAKNASTPDKVFINPEITRLSRAKREMSEGCLSVRGKYGTVVRHEKASIKAWDESGKPIVYHATGLLSHIFQHECDHLDGVLYTDKAVHVEEDEDMKSAREKLKAKHNI